MDPILLGVGIFHLIMLMAAIVVLMSLYRRVGCNEAMIISGGEVSRVIVDGGTVILPLIHKVQLISLELLTVDLKNTNAFRSSDGHDIFVEGVLQARIDSSEDAIRRAARNFGDKDLKEIRSTIYDIAFDCLRASLSSRIAAQSAREPVIIAQDVEDGMVPALASLGIVFCAFRIKSVRDASVLNDGAYGPVSYPVIKEDDDIVGRIGVITAPIDGAETGEVTYDFRSSSRRARTAMTKLIGMDLNMNTPVIITEICGDAVYVEPWQQIHASLPASRTTSFD